MLTVNPAIGAFLDAASVHFYIANGNGQEELAAASPNFTLILA
jgi:hypothetical protein